MELNIPKDRMIKAYNSFTGWFVTKYDNDLDKFPLYNLDGKAGAWFPVITKWKEY